MFQRNFQSISKRFTSIFIPSNSIHTNCNHIVKPFLLPNNNHDLLARRLAVILQACADFPFLQQGKQVHAQFLVNGVSIDDDPLCTKILAVYVLSGSFVDAIKLFYKLELCCSEPWNWMIRGFVKKGWFDFALLFYFKMLSCGVYPDKYTFPSLIKVCGSLKDYRLLMLIKDTIRSMELKLDAFIGSSMIKLFAEFGCIDDARELFDKISQKDEVLWNVMLNGYMKSGDLDKAVKVFIEMRNSETSPNSVTLACILSHCASEAMVGLGTQLHGLVVCFGLESDTSLTNTLLTMYSKCGQLFDSRKLFDSKSLKDLVTWNGMISGYVQNGFMEDAYLLFRDMVASGSKPDSITFSSFLPSVAESLSVQQGKSIHGYIVRHDVRLDLFLKSSLIDIYFKCKDVEMARKIFKQCSAIDVVVCTAMISGYVLNGMSIEALRIFRTLLEEQVIPNVVTLVSVLPACAALVALKTGKELHAHIVKRRFDQMCYVESATMDMYAKCGRLDLAHRIFERMSERDPVCWNSMITSCSQNGKPDEAIEIFREMGFSGTRYDCVSISAALSACASLPAQHYGKEIHSVVIKGAFSSDVFAESSLIDMYAKCGNLSNARRVFNMMRGEKNEVSWNSIIAAYGNHGCITDSISLFCNMLDEGIKPDGVTFLAIMSACGHAGRVEDGIRYFYSMTEEYGIQAQMEHYACMVDLYGRSGRLCEAFETIKKMPFLPDAGVWGTLLGACRVHGNVELAEVASRNLFELDPLNSGYYVLLSNIHAGAGRWGDVVKVRSLMKEKGVQKIPGYSWIDVNGSTHLFVAADGSHSQSVEIYSVLKMLLEELRREGYVPQPYLPVYPQTLVV